MYFLWLAACVRVLKLCNALRFSAQIRLHMLIEILIIT